MDGFQWLKKCLAVALAISFITSAAAESPEKIKAQLRWEKRPKVTFTYNGNLPQFNINGKRYAPLLYNCVYPWNFNDQNFVKQIKQLRKAGFRLFVIGEQTTDFWRANGTYDFEHIENYIFKILKLVPDAYFILAIDSSYPPSWWKNKHPGELIDYANGGVDPKGTIPLEHRVSNPSFASEVWRKDITDLYSRIVRHIESRNISKRIIAYRLDSGVTREWHYWGMREGMPDTGKAMTRAFRKYLKKVYNNDVNALRKAWNDPKADFENALSPDKAARLKFSAGSMRSPSEERYVVDYLRCLQHEVDKTMLQYNSAVKKACRNRVPVGNYSGYFFGMNYPAEGWHLNNDMLMNSQLVDFQSSPFTYNPIFRQIGESQLPRPAVASYPLHRKVCILEADTRTHLTGKNGHNHCETPQDSVASLARDLGHMLVNNTGMWFLDFGRTWYLDPQIMDFFQQMHQIARKQIPNDPIAEVALVTDFESVYFHGTGYYSAITYTAVNLAMRELTHTGIPFDVVSSADLAHPKLRDYKVFIFPNFFYIPAEKMKTISSLQKEGKTFIWYFAPGYLTEHGADKENMQKLLDMQLTVKSNTEQLIRTRTTDGRFMDPDRAFKAAPLFAVTDPAAEKLGTMAADGGEITTFARKKSASGAVNVYSASAFIDRITLRKVLTEAGVHCYSADEKAVILASSAYIVVHTAEGGEMVIKLPKKSKVTRLLPQSGEIGSNLTEFKFTAPPKSTTIFHWR